MSLSPRQEGVSLVEVVTPYGDQWAVFLLVLVVSLVGQLLAVAGEMTLNLLDDIVTTCNLGEERQGRVAGSYKGGYWVHRGVIRRNVNKLGAAQNVNRYL